jgi:SAM-dependent methyltransferase
MDQAIAAKTEWFVKDNGRKLPVSERFLLPFLSPTSPGTNYWDPPPSGAAFDRQRGRILLQLHQILDLLQRTGMDLKGKSMLDVGTGNGLIPRLLLEFSDLEKAVGIDPYLDGEHKTSWQPHDRDALFVDLAQYIAEQSPSALDFAKYRHLAGFEPFTLQPAPVPYRRQGSKQFRFSKIGAHDLEQLDEKFDFFYAKAIEHIPDWNAIMRSLSAVANPGAIVCFKHFSFFSYLGPHRYSTTHIPWGHLLLTDAEYRRYAAEFHANRAEKMADFYFTGLSYPRTPITNLVRLAEDHDFSMHAIINEPVKHVSRFRGLTREVDGFWDIVQENWPGLSAEEMLSGRYHILFRKN